MTRGEHRPSSGADAIWCARCGCACTRNRGMCPPGFWMTDDETKAWVLLDEKARIEAEEKLGRQEMRATQQRRGGST